MNINILDGKQNKEKIDTRIINSILENPPEDLAKNFVEINGDYFVHEAIMEFDDFDGGS